MRARSLILARLFLFFGLPIWLCSCEQLREVRGMFRPEGAFGAAALRVEVTPSTDIIIRLNGQTVAEASPYEASGLASGAHKLEVSAPGYYPITLPLQLIENKTVTVPVSLRRKSKTPATKVPKPPAGLDVADSVPPPPPAAPLPPNTPPIRVVLAPQPQVPLRHDGLALEGRILSIQQMNGELQAGVLLLTYDVGNEGRLRFTIPSAEAGNEVAWYKDGKVLEPGSHFYLHSGSTAIRRQAADGTDQTLLLRRKP